jgi:hypothetical protein
MTMFPFAPIPGGNVVPERPPSGATARPQPEPTTSESRFVAAVEKAAGPLEQLDVEHMFIEAGVDITAPEVQGYIAAATAQLQAAESEEEAQQTLLEVRTYLPFLVEQHPATPITTYALSLERSGFEGCVEPAATGPAAAAIGRKPGITPEIANRMAGKNFQVHPETGWIMFRNGVLVDPDVPLGSAGAVVYDPSSSAPGSPTWLRGVDRWSPEKVAEWKQRLSQARYLTKDEAQVKGIDVAFKAALSQYHAIRYQNGGTPLPANLAAGAAEAPEFNLTARDFQVQIRNDVREQYRSTFGNDPSDAELENWTRFVTQSALKAQKGLERKGATPSTALSLGATEAEERLIEGLQTSPEARFLRESVEENTSLRDALATAVSVTQSLAG